MYVPTELLQLLAAKLSFVEVRGGLFETKFWLSGLAKEGQRAGVPSLRGSH